MRAGGGGHARRTVAAQRRRPPQATVARFTRDAQFSSPVGFSFARNGAAIFTVECSGSSETEVYLSTRFTSVQFLSLQNRNAVSYCCYYYSYQNLYYISLCVCLGVIFMPSGLIAVIILFPVLFIGLFFFILRYRVIWCGLTRASDTFCPGRSSRITARRKSSSSGRSLPEW